MTVNEVKKVINKLLLYQERQVGFRSPYKLYKQLVGKELGFDVNYDKTEEGPMYWRQLLTMGSPGRDMILSYLYTCPKVGWKVGEDRETIIVDGQKYVL